MNKDSGVAHCLFLYSLILGTINVDLEQIVDWSAWNGNQQSSSPELKPIVGN